jgi:hypothetical protein
MTHSGDAAEQIVRISLEGVEVAAKITGTAAKEIATFLVAALKSDGKKLKLKGKARLASMLKSGKPLEIFSVKESDLGEFTRGAKEYGIVYCVLRNKKHDKDGMCDIMVKADDAPRISHLAKRLEFATVDKVKIENEIVQSKAEKSPAKDDAGQPAPDKDNTEKLLDDLLGTPEGKTEQENPVASKTAPAKDIPRSPEPAKAAKTRPSAPISESNSKSAEGTSVNKSSVRQELHRIKAAQKSKQEADAPKREEKQPTSKLRGNSSSAHKQPHKRGSKTKSRKPKVR